MFNLDIQPEHYTPGVVISLFSVCIKGPDGNYRAVTGANDRPTAKLKLARWQEVYPNRSFRILGPL